MAVAILAVIGLEGLLFQTRVAERLFELAASLAPFASIATMFWHVLQIFM